MWSTVLEKYPQIHDITLKDNFNLSFELYGILNKHLIIYPVKVDAMLLFCIHRDTGEIIPPTRYDSVLPNPSIHTLTLIDQKFQNVYKSIQKKIEESNKVLSDTSIEGTEGCVIYELKEDDTWKLWKLKPPSILAIHQAPGITKKDIMITCYNALENVDINKLTYEVVSELLEEEFEKYVIEKIEDKINKIIKIVIIEIKERYEAIRIYELDGISILKDKRKVMRRISEYFDSKKMRYIYTILEAYERGKLI